MIRAALGLLAVLMLAGCGGSGSDTPGAEQVAAPGGAAEGGVLELENVLQLRSDFEADAGKTRVLLLLSPT